MRSPILLLTLLVIAFNSAAQTAGNGLSTDNNQVQLGGSLIKTTTIDQNGFYLHLRNGNTPLFTTLANGNVGIGTQTPNARLSFLDVHLSEDPIGISWYNGSNGGDGTQYGIHRTAGPWTGPDYAQLRVGWLTGIVLDPGTAHGKSYVDIKGNGLRVTSGIVGIGTSNPNHGALVIEKSNTTGEGAGPVIYIKNTNTVLPAGNGYNVSGIDCQSGNGAVLGQLVSNYGVGTGLPYSGGSGFYITTRTEHPIIFATGAASTEKARIGSNGNFLIGSTTDNGNKLQVNGTVQSTGLKLNANNPIYWGDPNTSITRLGDVLTLKEYTGQINLTGVQGLRVAFNHPAYGNATFSFPSNNVFALRQGDSYILQTSRANQNECWIKLGATAPQYYDAPGTRLYLNGGKGGHLLTNNGGDVFIDGGEKGSAAASDGNVLIGTQFGKVGIGTTTPSSQLHTTGSVRFAGLTNDNAKDRVIVSDANGDLSYRDAATLGGSSTAGWAFGGNAVPASSTLGTTSNYDLPVITNNIERMRIGANGNVGIGTTAISNFKLSVEGNIRARKVRIEPDVWADYVFESNYKLLSLKEVEQYIQQEKHLPDVPSAAEVKKEGLDIGDNQAVLLRKIEELTLYVIQQQKQLEAQQQKIELLERKMNKKK